MKENTLYVLCDNTLDPMYAAVQGGHAVAEWMMYQKIESTKLDIETNWKWTNQRLVYLSVDINKWYKWMQEYDAKYWEEFFETDLGDRVTAIAIYDEGLSDILRNKIRKEPLLK